MTSKRHIDEWVCLFDERHVVKRAALGQGVLQPEKQLTMKVIIEIIRVMIIVPGSDHHDITWPLLDIWVRCVLSNASFRLHLWLWESQGPHCASTGRERALCDRMPPGTGGAKPVQPGWESQRSKCCEVAHDSDQVAILSKSHSIAQKQVWALCIAIYRERYILHHLEILRYFIDILQCMNGHFWPFLYLKTIVTH